MQNKRNIILWVIGTIVGFLVIMALVVGLLTLINGSNKAPSTEDTSNTPATEVVEPPKTNTEAESLKTEADKAMSEQKFDEAIEKYTAAKVIYENEKDEMHASDLQMQIDTATAQKAAVSKNNEQNKAPTLRPTGR